ncbi:MAG TPA: patatin-like phospholipase family protein [Acidimicrobiales bacterium]|nr:patatin-like phospholipase family protein [Acidimicrobiales bacterium]
MSTALVLGAGGLTGSAFHAGALQGLRDAGWDAATADLVVGTSAGSSTGASLRADIPVEDLYAGHTGGRVSDATEAKRRRLPTALDFTAPPAVEGRRPLSAALGSRALLRRGLPRWGLLYGGLAPRGRMDSLRIAARIDGVYDGVRWPEDPFWVCAVRVRDGRLRVFGREASEATVGQAVAASSAVPGLLAPVEIDGQDHVDGAVHSPTNADQVAGLGFDRVVVVAPMAGRVDWRQTVRAYHAQLLRQEAAKVRSRGSEVVVIEPDADVLEAMGPRAMTPGREKPVAEAARRLGAAALSR